MKRLLPAPLLSVGLLALWLLLNRSLSGGHLLLGLALALILPILTAPLHAPAGPLRRPLVALQLVLRVGWHIVKSGLQVAGGVLRSRTRPPPGAFIVVPLELRDTRGLAALAMITAVIPGTVWSELAADHSRLLLHVFDPGDVAAFIRHYKRDYEQPLREIFE